MSKILNRLVNEHYNKVLIKKVQSDVKEILNIMNEEKEIDKNYDLLRKIGMDKRPPINFDYKYNSVFYRSDMMWAYIYKPLGKNSHYFDLNERLILSDVGLEDLTTFANCDIDRTIMIEKGLDWLVCIIFLSLILILIIAIIGMLKAEVEPVSSILNKYILL